MRAAGGHLMRWNWPAQGSAAFVKGALISDNGNTIPAGHDSGRLDMIGVLVGQHDGYQGGRVDVALAQVPFDPARGQAAVDQKRSFPCLHQDGIAGTAGGQALDPQAHEEIAFR